MKSESPVVPGRDLPEIKIAEHQDEYQTLHAVKSDGALLMRFSLDDAERFFISRYGYFYLWVWKPEDAFFHPILPMAAHPDFEPEVEVPTKSETSTEGATCQLCGMPMPKGEEMFNYHGYSGPCPAPPKSAPTPGASTLCNLFVRNARRADDNGFVASIYVPDFNPMPGALMWGNRIFVRDEERSTPEEHRYEEVFCYAHVGGYMTTAGKAEIPGQAFDCSTEPKTA